MSRSRLDPWFVAGAARPAVVGLTAAWVGRAYARRIAAEERLLRRDLPGYAEYTERTHRLIPLAW